MKFDEFDVVRDLDFRHEFLGMQHVTYVLKTACGRSRQHTNEFWGAWLDGACLVPGNGTADFRGCYMETVNASN
jgi:hypothetical protein